MTAVFRPFVSTGGSSVSRRGLGFTFSMILRQLSCFTSSFLSHQQASVRCRRASSCCRVTSLAPPPWWQRQGFPPRPPPHPCPHPAPRQRVPTRATIGSCRLFYTSASVTMERPNRDREPPHKRRKSESEEKEGYRRGAHGGGRDGGREKHVERIKTDNKEGNRGHRESHPTPPPRTTPVRAGPRHSSDPRHKPWRGESGSEERRGATPPTNPWQAAGANRAPPPRPGTGPPTRQRQDAALRALKRHWEASPACSTEPPPPGSSTCFDFSVMSYNILSQELLQDNSYLYRHCPPGVLPWDYRLPNLLAEIHAYDADILCLQEVQEDHYERQIKPALQAHGYQCEYKKRTGGKPDGCAVVFRTSRLSLVSSNPVEFLRPGDALLDRDNVGLVVLLRPTHAAADPSSVVCVANTHLLYNPRRGDIKLAQLAILLAEIGRLSRRPDGSSHPVLLCGDFNSTPWSPLYSFLTRGRLDYEGLQIGVVSGQELSPRGQRLLTSPIWSQTLGINQRCQYDTEHAKSSSSSSTAVEETISHLTVDDLSTNAATAFSGARIEHGLRLLSSYQHRLMPDGRPAITTCHSRTAMTVDYILYTPELMANRWHPGGRGLQLLGRLSLVGQAELEEVNGLPNPQHSSDHLPLLARFRYRC